MLNLGIYRCTIAESSFLTCIAIHSFKKNPSSKTERTARSKLTQLSRLRVVVFHSYSRRRGQCAPLRPQAGLRNSMDGGDSESTILGPNTHPSTLGPASEYTGTSSRMRAGPRACCPAAQGSARECEVRLEGKGEML